MAKGLQIPVFHVNGDDPEAVARVGELAFDYRQEFGKDVVIDMVCYRRRGHNEGDDPSMTQPVMYGLIEKKRSVRKLYTEALIGRGDLTVEQAEEALQHYHAELERAFTETRDTGYRPPAESEPVAGLERPESQLEDAGTMVGWRTATTSEVLERIGTRSRQPAGGLHGAPEARAPPGPAGADVPRGRDRLGLRRDPRVRVAPHGGHARSASRGRTLAAARSSSATPSSTTASRARSGRR